jgi:hypothetical protein
VHLFVLAGRSAHAMLSRTSANLPPELSSYTTAHSVLFTAQGQKLERKLASASQTVQQILTFIQFTQAEAI